MGVVMQAAIIGLVAFLAAVIDTFEKIFTFIVELPNKNEIMESFDITATAVGVSLTTAFLAMEIFSMASEFKTERIEDAIRIGMKFVIFKIIIENTGGLCAGIYDLFADLGASTISGQVFTLLRSIQAHLAETSGALDPEKTWAGIFQLPGILDTIGYTAIIIVTIGIMISIALTLAGVVFEVAVHRAVAPIALSTLVNSTTRQTGVSFIKSYSACCLQFFVISTMVGAGAMIIDLMTELTKDNALTPDGKFLFSDIIGALGPVFGLMIISNGIKKSGDMTKRLLGA